MSSGTPTYLPGLNGIRAIAASIVLLWHADQFAYLFGLESYGYGANGMSGSAVTFFFVLSGFLITLLLIKEKERFESVDVIRFYGRRILRIWPVYYLALFASLLVVQHLPTDRLPEQKVLAFSLYLGLLPNAALAWNLGILSIKPLWSVGVEEQFYLVWPWLVRRAKNLPRVLWTIIVGFLVLKIGARFLEDGPFYELLRLTTIDCMAMGGLCAWMVHTRSRWLRLIYARWLQVSCWCFLVVSIVHRPIQLTSLLDAETQGVVYAVLITNVSTNPATLLTLENPIANFFGRISYGMYVYHMPVICVLSHYFSPLVLNIHPAWARQGVVIGLVFTVTVMLALVSYRYFETPFLARKSKLALIPSTDKSQVNSSNS